ncbi:MAG: hypothetical protein CMH56_00230 [Myxococcales bacterium]|nr:hypothetical protein [Myxococcales bacterium]|tara:strand:- start:2317 stop:4311 length:1995 start_codon:yes stop_codon:yes gene_type:complete
MSHDAAGLLEALGAAADAKQANHYQMPLDPLGLTSIFGSPLAGMGQVQVLSEHALCFQEPQQMAALGPLWVENVEQKSELVSMLADALARLKKTLAEHASEMVSWGLSEPHLMPPVSQIHGVIIQDGSRMTYRRVDDHRLELAWVDGRSAVALGVNIDIAQELNPEALQQAASQHLNTYRANASPSETPSEDLQVRVRQLEERLKAVLEETAAIQQALMALQPGTGDEASQTPAPLEGLPALSQEMMPEPIPVEPASPSIAPPRRDASEAPVAEAELPVVISMSDLEPVASEEQPVDDEDFEDAPPTIAMDMSMKNEQASDIASLAEEQTANNPQLSSPGSVGGASGFEEPATVAMDLAAPFTGMGFESATGVKGTSASEKLSQTAQGLSGASLEIPSTKEDPPQDTEDRELAAFFAEAQEPEAGILDSSDIGDPFSEPDRVHEVDFEDEHDDGPTAIGHDFLDPKTEAYVLGTADSAIVDTGSQFDSDLGLSQDAEIPEHQSFPANPLEDMLPREDAPLETSAPTAISPLREEETDPAEGQGVFSDGEEDEPTIALVLRHEKARRKLTQKLTDSIPNLQGVESARSLDEELEIGKVQTLVYVRPIPEILDEIIDIKENHPSLKVVVVTNDNRFVDVPQIDLMLPLVNQVSQVAQSILDGLHLL